MVKYCFYLAKAKITGLALGLSGDERFWLADVRLLFHDHQWSQMSETDMVRGGLSLRMSEIM